MSAEVVLDLRDEGQRSYGSLTIAELPRSEGRLRDLTDDPDRPPAAPTVELQEESTYWFELNVEGKIRGVEPDELFSADPRRPERGRLKIGRAVGEIDVVVAIEQPEVTIEVRTRVDVRPRKLADEAAYRAMLRDISDVSIELLHQGFAPSAGRYGVVAGRPPQLIYQQFALLHLHLFEQRVEWALARIVAHPFQSWETSTEERPHGAPIKGSSRLERSLAAPGPRAISSRSAMLGTVPRRLHIDRTESTLDNLPNRYVRFVLERWRSIAAETLQVVETGPATAPRRRGRSQALRTIARLDALLAQPLFRQTGTLRAFPQGNQVLLKRDGYRQIAAAAAVVESSLGLGLELEDPFLVSQRNIATLYEYWCFIRVVEAVGHVCGRSRTAELFSIAGGGMSLTLARDKLSEVEFDTKIRGRVVTARLSFNRRFKIRSGRRTADLKPDCSLRLRAAGPSGCDDREWWLHFDAKYQFKGDAITDEALTAATDGLVKMHAYRDAIAHTAGAFVLFPGSASETRDLADEMLPAIGAFPLRPNRSDDVDALEQFIRRAFRHVADQSSRLERARHWSDLAYSGEAPPTLMPMVPFLNEPPADTAVLVGYVRSLEQRKWIERTGLYNVRAEGAGAFGADALELDARLLLLYGTRRGRAPPVLYRRRSQWAVYNEDTMRRVGYPGGGRSTYLCCEIEPLSLPWIEQIEIDKLVSAGRRRTGRAFRVSWVDVWRAVQH